MLIRTTKSQIYKPEKHQIFYGENSNDNATLTHLVFIAFYFS